VVNILASKKPVSSVIVADILNNPEIVFNRRMVVGRLKLSIFKNANTAKIFEVLSTENFQTAKEIATKTNLPTLMVSGKLRNLLHGYVDRRFRTETRICGGRPVKTRTPEYRRIRKPDRRL